MTWYLDQGCTAQFDLAGKSPWAPLINEVQTDLICYRDNPGPVGTGRAWFRGRMGSSTDTADETGSHDCTFSAVDYRGFLTNARTIWPGSATLFANLDISAAVWEMIAQSQALSFGNLFITKGEVAKTGVIVPFEAPNNISNFPTFNIGDYIGEDIDTLSTAFPGFDWEIDAYRRFNLWSPQRGSVKPVVLEYGSSVTKVVRTLDTTQFANAIIGTGSWSPQTDICSIWAGETHVLDQYAQAAFAGYQVQGPGIVGAGSTVITSVLSARQLPPFSAVGTGAWPEMTACSSTSDTITFNFSRPAPVSPGATFDTFGCSPDGFNGHWTVASAPGNAITVASTANPDKGGSASPGSASSASGTLTFTNSHGLDVGTIINLEFGNGPGYTNDNYFVTKVNGNTVTLGNPQLPAAVPTNIGSAYVPSQWVMSAPATQTNSKVVLLLSVFRAIAQPSIGPEGRWERTVNDTTIVSKEILDSWTEEQAINFAGFLPSYVCDLRPGWWDPTVLWIGDTCRFVCASGRLQVNELSRVVQIDVTISDDGGPEQVRVTLNARPATEVTRLRDYRRQINNLSRR